MTPEAPASPGTAAHAPSTALRSRGRVKVVVRIERAAGAISAAPAPWARRAAIRAASVCAKPAGERGEREQAEPAEEDTAAADQVGGTAAEEQEAAVGEHIAADDPLQVLGRETQVVLDRGQSDVDDRDVEKVQELNEQQEVSVSAPRAAAEPSTERSPVRGAPVGAAASFIGGAPNSDGLEVRRRDSDRTRRRPCVPVNGQRRGR